ncbi:hypothetical protein DH2020_047209 [Rehmannia glutinosa]|uniref:Pyruvate kinase n=1 Tax=Rehmannia glutinosa TaxID=99300 RepID=A0ABR0U961_REHGL
MGHLNNNIDSMFCSNYSMSNGKQDTLMIMPIRIISPYYDDQHHQKRPKTKIVCTLGPSSRSMETIEKLLRGGMNVARFNFSHGTHAYHQETLDNLRAAVRNTGILCAVMLDTKGPEIRTGFLKDGKPIQLKQGQEITISTDYTIKGNEQMISMSYKKLAEDLKPQSTILCSDGTISLTVLDCNKALGLVRCRCENTAVLGECKNVNLPGVVVDLPTLTDKDRIDILEWGVPNKVDIIALSFVRKGSDLVEARKLLGDHAKSIVLMSKANTCGDRRVANAVIDGARLRHLCGETTAGAICLAVETMAKICIEAENSLDYGQIFQSQGNASAHESIGEFGVCGRARQANRLKAAMILVLVGRGDVAKLVAKYRPSVPIV